MDEATRAGAPRTSNVVLAEPVVEPRIPVITEYVGIGAFFSLCGWLLVRVCGAANPTSSWLLVLAGTVGFVGSDFFSGLVHWGFDTWGAPTTPVLGRTFIIPFRVHHSDPLDITRHGFVATNGHNCLSAVPILAGALLVSPNTAWGAMALVALVALCLGVFGTNQFHKWAHEPHVGPFIHFLQDRGIILSPAHHDQHHVAPHDTNYCITTGWMNPFLARIRFFKRAERVITAVTGAHPRVDDLKKGTA